MNKAITKSELAVLLQQARENVQEQTRGHGIIKLAADIALEALIDALLKDEQ